MLKTKLTVLKHIAIIPDGNRRWAKEKGLAVFAGHKKSAGFDNVVPIIEEARKLGVRYFTLWGLSTENWKRPQKELKFLFKLINKFSEDFGNYAINNKIRFRHIGRKDRLPKKTVEIFTEMEEKTKDFKEFNVQIALDYGGRDEIMRAVNLALKSGKKKIGEKEFRGFLGNEDIPDPEMILRTSGEMRTSGFFSFQGDYAELFFIDKYFPDFSPRDLKKSVEEFFKRKRNFGK